jgi:hypothetical protein
MSLNSDWQNFINERLDEKNIFTYIQGLQEIISNLNPKTLAESRRLQIAKGHLREVRKYARKMQNDMISLEEELREIKNPGDSEKIIEEIGD